MNECKSQYNSSLEFLMLDRVFHDANFLDFNNRPNLIKESSDIKNVDFNNKSNSIKESSELNNKII